MIGAPSLPNGHVRIHRGLIGNPQFRGKDDEYAALWLICYAVWRNTSVRIGGEKVVLQRGQCAFAISYLARAWECSKATAHWRLRLFEKNGFLQTLPRTHYTLITLCNYDEYQAASKKPERSPERAPNALRTNKKEDKEGNKRRGENSSVLVDIWNEVLEGALHEVTKPISEARKKSLMARMAERFDNDPEKWRAYLEHINRSDFLMGRTERSDKNKNWKLTFNWVINPANCEKILEGAYDNQKGNSEDEPLTVHEEAMLTWMKGGEKGEPPRAEDYPGVG